MVRLLMILCLCLMPALASATDYPVTVTDSLGRQVTIPARPEAVLLGSGFNLIALSLIEDDPVRRLAGWSTDLKGDNPELYADFATRFPALADLPAIGDGTGGSLSLEVILTLRSDLAILANWQAETEDGRRLIAVLEETGVPVIVVDFNSNAIGNTPSAMRLLGTVLDREAAAEAFATFYEERLARIRDRVAADARQGPTVLMDAFPNAEKCCYAYGTGGLGAFITLAGGRNVADRNLPPQGGMVSSEYLIAAEPEVYIATSSPGGAYSPLSIGPGVALDDARKGLSGITAMPVLSNLKAIRDKRVHGLWNFFNAVPLNIVAAEAFATWIRPDLFADVDPQATLEEINQRFAAVPFRGAYWASLPEN